MASCKTHKYQILEYIMKKVIFENQSLRQSFIDEMLNTCSHAAMRNYYITYIHSGVAQLPNFIQNMTANLLPKRNN